MRSVGRMSSLAFAMIIAGVAVGTTAAEARPKKFKLMNSCSCACRQDDGGDTVYISNKDFYSVASCGSYNNTACDVTVSTSEGTHQVTGTWEGCVDHGKVWVRAREAASRDLQKLTVDPGAIVEQPNPKGDVVRPVEPPMSADPGPSAPPADERRPPEGAADETLERAPN